MNRHFLEEVTHVAKKTYEKSSTSLTIREMQINHNEIPFHTSQNVYYYKVKK